MAGSKNSFDVPGLARFAIEDRNKKKNATLQFEKVVWYTLQPRAGGDYSITIEAKVDSVKKRYKAKVYADPLMNIREVHDFMPLEEAHAITLASRVTEDMYKPASCFLEVNKVEGAQKS